MKCAITFLLCFSLVGCSLVSEGTLGEALKKRDQAIYVLAEAIKTLQALELKRAGKESDKNGKEEKK